MGIYTDFLEKLEKGNVEVFEKDRNLVRSETKLLQLSECDTDNVIKKLMKSKSHIGETILSKRFALNENMLESRKYDKEPIFFKKRWREEKRLLDTQCAGLKLSLRDCESLYKAYCDQISILKAENK